MAEFLRDSRLMEMRHHVALLDGRMEDQLSRLSQGGGSGGAWRRAVELFAEARAAVPEEDEILAGALAAGAKDEEIWRETLTTAETRRRIVGTHAMVERAGRDYVTAGQLEVLLYEIVDLQFRTVDAVLERAAELTGLNVQGPELSKIRREAISDFSRTMEAATARGAVEVN